MELDLVPGILRNRQTVMYRIGRAGRNQPHVHHGTSGPCVSLVNRMSMLVELKCAIEMRAFFYGAFTIIVHASAPEQCLAAIINSLQFQPGIIRIYGAAREKMADAAGAHYYIHA